MRAKWGALWLCVAFFSCALFDDDDSAYIIEESSAEIAARAFAFAKAYEEAGAEYAWGAQDSLRAIKIDCSGLVVMSYCYALEGTPFALLQDDMSAAYMAQYASAPKTLGELRRGDLLFMGEAKSSAVSHIALFDCVKEGVIYFIDSTQKDEDGDGVYEINGVSSRSYQAEDKRFKGFGVMKLRR